MKKFSYLLSIVLMFAFFSNGFSQNRGNWGGMQRGGMNLYAGNLNLTTEQTTKLNDIRNAFSKETLALRTELQSKAMEVRTLMPELEKNQTKIISLQKEMLTARQKLQEKSLQIRINARKVLTAEQAAMLPAGRGMGLGFGLANGSGQGRGYGKGMGNGRGNGGGRGQGYRSANCPYRY